MRICDGTERATGTVHMDEKIELLLQMFVLDPRLLFFDMSAANGWTEGTAQTCASVSTPPFDAGPRPFMSL